MGATQVSQGPELSPRQDSCPLCPLWRTRGHTLGCVLGRKSDHLQTHCVEALAPMAWGAAQGGVGVRVCGRSAEAQPECAQPTGRPALMEDAQADTALRGRGGDSGRVFHTPFRGPTCSGGPSPLLLSHHRLPEGCTQNTLWEARSALPPSILQGPGGQRAAAARCIRPLNTHGLLVGSGNLSPH